MPTSIDQVKTELDGIGSRGNHPTWVNALREKNKSPKFMHFQPELSAMFRVPLAQLKRMHTGGVQKSPYINAAEGAGKLGPPKYDIP